MTQPSIALTNVDLAIMLSHKTEESIFQAACEIESDQERAAYLERECGEDRALRGRLDALLDIHLNDPDYLHISPVSADASSGQGLTACLGEVNQPGDSIGPYKIREQIGEGGMGIVYVAEQSEPVKRKVALKVIKPGMDSKQVIARFEAERQALAMMDHPNIARVIDAGTTASGLPYFAMDLVRGLPIAEYCDKYRLNTKERLRLFLDVCEAVQHAHQKGIIHRDLKPTNVLVTRNGDRAIPKVIDFGLAKATGNQLTDGSIYTHFHQMLGTPLYMSPEQAELSELDVDTRSDIYSLGVILYELLTGTTPFGRETLKSKGLEEFRRIIRETEPPRPSQRISTVNAADGETLDIAKLREIKRFKSELSGELDWIVMKALEKDRSRRYQSALAFADDIRHFLDNEPVQACPPSPIYRLRKTVSRNRAAVTTAALIVLALALGLGLATTQAFRARAAEVVADGERKAAQQNLDAAMNAIEKLMQHVGNPVLAEIPQAQSVRQEILRDTLEFYQQFQQSTGNSSPEVRFQVAMAKQQLGDLVVDARQWTQGSEILREASTELEQLVNENPDNRDFRRGYATVLGRLSLSLMWGHGEFSEDETELRREGIRHYQSQQKQFEDLCHRDPENFQRYRLKITESQIRQAQGHLILEEHAAAGAILEPVWQRLRNQGHRPGSTEFELFAMSQVRLGRALYPSDYQRAKQLLMEATDLIEQALSHRPRRAIRQEFVRQIIWPSTLLNDHGEPELALKYMEPALHQCQLLRKDYPTIGEYVGFLNKACGVALDIAKSRIQIAESEGNDDKYAAASEYLNELLIRMARDYEIHNYPAREMAEKEDAIERLSEAIEDYPDAPDYYYWRAMTYRSQDQIDLALADCDQSCQRLSGNLFHPYFPVRPFQLKAVIYRDLSDYRAAIECFTKQIDIFAGRHNYHSYFGRAFAYFEVGDFDACLNDLRLILLEPEMEHLLSAEKVANCDDASFRDGYMQLVREAIENADSNIEPSINLASILMLQGKRSAAIATLDEASAKWQFGRNQLHTIQLYKIGLVYLASGELQKYRQICEELLEQYGEPNIHTGKATTSTIWPACLSADALEDYTRVVAIARSFHEARDKSWSLSFLGRALFRARDYEEAWEALSAVIDSSNQGAYSNALNRYFLAMTAHQLGKMDDAVAQLRKAHELCQQELSNGSSWSRRMTLELLQEEAESLIEP